MPRKRTLVTATILIVVLIPVFLCFVPASKPNRAVIPGSATLTLIGAAYTTNGDPVPKTNPFVRAWYGVCNTLPKPIRRALIGTMLPIVHTSAARAAVFWFREELVKGTNAPLAWVAVGEGVPPSPHHLPYNANTVRTLNQPDVVGLVWMDCPTNTPNLNMAFYRTGQSQYITPEEFSQTNVVARITLKNPAYRK